MQVESCLHKHLTDQQCHGQWRCVYYSVKALFAEEAGDRELTGTESKKAPLHTMHYECMAFTATRGKANLLSFKWIDEGQAYCFLLAKSTKQHLPVMEDGSRIKSRCGNGSEGEENQVLAAKANTWLVWWEVWLQPDYAVMHKESLAFQEFLLRSKEELQVFKNTHTMAHNWMQLNSKWCDYVSTSWWRFCHCQREEGKWKPTAAAPRRKMKPKSSEV